MGLQADLRVRGAGSPIDPGCRETDGFGIQAATLSRRGGVGLTVGLGELRGLFQP